MVSAETVAEATSAVTAANADMALQCNASTDGYTAAKCTAATTVATDAAMALAAAGMADATAGMGDLGDLMDGLGDLDAAAIEAAAKLEASKDSAIGSFAAASAGALLAAAVIVA